MINNFERIGKLPILLFIFSHSIFAQSPALKFERLSTEHGLSHSSVYCIFQDSKGFLWFGTENGLNRYDGYEFTTYYYEPGDTSSLSNSWVWSILEDHTGTLWIGTVDGEFWVGSAGSGLYKFDRETKNSSHYRIDPLWAPNTSPDFIEALCVDRNGELWVGASYSGGLHR